jgi:hypothetical protein
VLRRLIPALLIPLQILRVSLNRTVAFAKPYYGLSHVEYLA